MHVLFWPNIYPCPAESGLSFFHVFSYLSEVGARGLLNLGKKFLDHKKWKNLVQSERTGQPFFFHQSRAITLYLFEYINQSTITNQFYPISSLIQSLKKIGQKMLKIESGNKDLTDRQMDGHSNTKFKSPHIF